MSRSHQVADSIRAWADHPNQFEEMLKALVDQSFGRSAHYLAFAALTGTIWPQEYPAIPYDSSDFSACLRLTRRFPFVRERLPVLLLDPNWAPIIHNWLHLSALCDAGRYTDLSDVLRLLRKDGSHA